MNILLIEPNYKVRLPSLALMKFSTYYKQQGHNVKYIKTDNVALLDYKADFIHITSTFTWDLDHVIAAINSAKHKYPQAKITIGGVGASMMPEHIYKHTGMKPHFGIDWRIEDIPPDYSLHPELETCFAYSSRGCINKCVYCVVPRMEGKIQEVPNWWKSIDPSKKKIEMWDNNFLACSKEHIKKTIDILRYYNLYVDFNQALDCMKLTPEIADQLCTLKMQPFRFAYDKPFQEKYIRTMFKLLVDERGVNPHDIHILILFNFNETPEEAHYKCRVIQDELGGVPFAMCYKPLDWLSRDTFVSDKWTLQEIKDFRAFWNRESVSKVHKTYSNYINSKKRYKQKSSLMDFNKPTVKQDISLIEY